MEPVVAWLDRRQDVVNALEILARTEPSMDGWPGLTEAVHWLVDDTFWDTRSPGEDVGLLLVDAVEAAAVETAVRCLLIVARGVGPTAEDSASFGHPAWPAVAEAAQAALQVLTGHRPAL